MVKQNSESFATKLETPNIELARLLRNERSGLPLTNVPRDQIPVTEVPRDDVLAMIGHSQSAEPAQLIVQSIERPDGKDIEPTRTKSTVIFQG